MTTATDRPRHVVGLLVRREVRSRLIEKSFRISMVVSLLAIVAVAVLPKVFADDPTTWEIGAVGQDSASVAEVAASSADPGREASVVSLDSADDARRAVEDGHVDVAVLDDGTLLADSELDDELGELLAQSVRTDRLSAELRERGVPEADVTDLARPATVQTELLDPPDADRDRRTGFAAIGVILMFIQLIGYCVWVATGVVEEKSSRVVEVLLAKVRPRHLLAAKVIGIGAIGIAQLLVFVAVGLGAFALADRFPIPPGVWPLAIAELVAFAFGYLLYACLFSIAGSLAARSEDLQATSAPFSLLLTGAYVAGIFATQDPGGSAAKILSLVPFTSPLVMPLRIADGSAAIWEIVAAAAAIVVMAALLLLLAERVNRGGVLRTERSTKFREAFALGGRR